MTHEGIKPTTESLLTIMEKLRSPDGCPWDRQQTHQTLKHCLAEECAELMDAIDDAEPEAICEELGDILMIVVFNAVVAAEQGHFHLRDVLAGVIEKMIRRHPHVFGDEDIDSAEEVLRVWQKIKQTEKKPARQSLLDGVPRHLSALLAATAVQKKAASVGFDWTCQQQIVEKIDEELKELKDAVAVGREDEVDEEIGDLLFSLVNLARFRKRRSAEELLAATTRKFKRRFEYIEEHFEKSATGLEAASIEQLEALWQEAKRHEAKSDCGVSSQP